MNQKNQIKYFDEGYPKDSPRVYNHLREIMPFELGSVTINLEGKNLPVEINCSSLHIKSKEELQLVIDRLKEAGEIAFKDRVKQ